MRDSLEPVNDHLAEQIELLVAQMTSLARSHQAAERSVPTGIDTSSTILAMAASRSLQAARVLAGMMRGSLSLHPSEEARIAGILYNRWQLPPGPALAALLDQDGAPFQRWTALTAIAGYADSAWFAPAFVSMACDIGAAAQGRYEVRHAQAPDDNLSAMSEVLKHSLSREERELLNLGARLTCFRSRNAVVPQDLAQRLGSDNVVVKYLRAFWQQNHCGRRDN
jgi:hypothetical protein